MSTDIVYRVMSSAQLIVNVYEGDLLVAVNVHEGEGLKTWVPEYDPLEIVDGAGRQQDELKPWFIKADKEHI